MDKSGSGESSKKLLHLVHIVETGKGLHVYHERKREVEGDCMAFWVNRLNGMLWGLNKIIIFIIYSDTRYKVLST